MQLEPYKFSSSWWHVDLAEVVMGQPKWFANFDLKVLSFLGSVSFLANLGSWLIELVIGLLMIATNKFSNLLIIVSLFWVLTVWVVGEGFGMSFTGFALFNALFPGSVLFYLLFTIVIEINSNKLTQQSETINVQIVQGVLVGFLALGITSLFLLKHPINQVVFANLIEASNSEPRPFQSVNSWIAYHVVLKSLAVSYFIIIFPIASGLWFLVRKNLTSFMINSLYWFIVWILFQSAGSIFNFSTTDVGTSPFIILIFSIIFASRFKTANYNMHIKDKAVEDLLLA